MKLSVMIIGAIGLALLTARMLAARAPGARRRSGPPDPRAGRLVAVGGVRLGYVERGFGPAVVLLRASGHDRRSAPGAGRGRARPGVRAGGAAAAHVDGRRQRHHAADGADAPDDTLALLDRIAEHGLRAIALDRPGHADGHGAGMHITAAEEARLIHAAAEALGAHRPILVAHGDGAAIACRYALDYPGDAAGLLVISPDGLVPDAADPRPYTRAVRDPVVVIGGTVGRRDLPDRIVDAIRELRSRSAGG